MLRGNNKRTEAEHQPCCQNSHRAPYTLYPPTLLAPKSLPCIFQGFFFFVLFLFFLLFFKALPPLIFLSTNTCYTCVTFFSPSTLLSRLASVVVVECIYFWLLCHRASISLLMDIWLSLFYLFQAVLTCTSLCIYLKVPGHGVLASFYNKVATSCIWLGLKLKVISGNFSP